MHLLDSSLVPCKNLECETFETIHRLKFYFKSNKECDSEISKKIDGVIIVEKLIHALVNDGLGRGIHRGEFEWLVPGSGFPFRAIGEMAGITNAGKYRNPLKECETCDTKGRMEGRIIGQIVEGELKGCEIYGSYLIEFKPSPKFEIAQNVRGTLEEVISCFCQ